MRLFETDLTEASMIMQIKEIMTRICFKKTHDFMHKKGKGILVIDKSYKIGHQYLFLLYIYVYVT